LKGQREQLLQVHFPRIIEALRMLDGILITFEDGKCALYTADFLYAMFPNADELMQDMIDEG